ncbi:ABC transporter permease/M1 family aminopeptidase [Sphingomonas sp. 28-63-12]|uniref:ABC transporter permease/M1 family aminopeptidase n=1 Tax=Sphingomonas sp. 28-63-12 TaxID=1970434 RepID=UPI000BD041CC|nr:MAG: aminopeptidase [Sphingomonas sp. 28-63-12]
MFAKIAAFELRYQFRNPVFWVVSILFFLLVFGAATIQQVQIGSGGNIHKNSPFAIAQTHLIMSLFFMFVTTAFVANVIVRDDESGFGPMVRSTRVTKFDYLLARFLGAFVAAVVAFAAVPLAMWVGSFMPWVDPETLGANRLADYAYAYFVLALPNVFLTSAIFFAVATMTRSMMYSYVGVIVFLVIYVVFNSVIRTQPNFREWAGYVEPFGIGAFSTVTRYWTATESNTLTPPLTGMLIANRVVWIGVALGALALAYARFSFTERGVSKRKLSKMAKKEARLAATAPLIVAMLPATRPKAAATARMIARVRFEMAQVFKSPAFFVLMLVGLFNAGGGLYFANELYGTPARPLTFAVLQVLFGAFGLIPIIIAIYYSGELVWRDRDRKMHEIIDATSLPNWAYLVPKVLAVSGVLFATILISMLAGVLIQLSRGQTDLALGHYFAWYIVPTTVDMILLAILAIFVQALSPNKYIGWAIMVIYFVATITLGNIGFEHPLYTYGSTGNVQLSDMNGDNIGGATGWWLRLYWGAIALILAVLAHLLWRRGTAVSLSARLRRVPSRLNGVPGVLAGIGVLTAAASGAFIFYNMNVLNDYRTRDDNEKQQANYEKKYLKYETLKQPSTTDIALKVDLYPAQKRMEASGRYLLINDTGAPVNDLHVRFASRNLNILDVSVPGATLAMDDKENRYRIYHFTQPMAPGAAASLAFKTERWQHGFRAQGDDTQMVENGTFLNNIDFTPIIGMSRDQLLQDRVKRRKYGLPAERRMAKLEDISAQQRNYLINADWVHSDITVSTDAGQTPIAPGKKMSDVIAGGRRTAHFVSTAPILAFFSVQSAAYAEKSADAGGGVTTSVFYDPKHGYNVDRMLKAMKLSLDYYRANFGPYQFDYARIVEFPGYATFAQAFGGTIPYSERIGFIADTRDPNNIDFVSYVTAHELAHQYWAHQLASADMQGGTVLVETMAQYSAMMVMKHLYGEDKMRRFLKYELDSYLRARGSEVIEELPLERVENQGYIHYRKGSLVMYLLQDRLGEARMNQMLSGLLDKYRFKSQPYARSLDLVDGLKSLARNEGERQLISDLFEKITIWDLKTKDATVTKLADGRYQTVLTVTGDKFYADGKGKETKAALSDVIDIGLFDARPGIGAFSAKDVDLIERRPVASGEQKITIISKKKPAFAGIDPYNKYIDRNSDDNVVAVTG